MIRYKVGDLIEEAKKGNVSVIAHCCNCFCTMGSGIAPQIKKNFPYAWHADEWTKKGDPAKMGTFSVGIPEEGDWENHDAPDVFNLYGQFGYGKRAHGGRDLDYDALYDAFNAMATQLKEWGYEDQVIGLPLLGAGLAGGNWKVISVMIEETLGKTGLDILVCVLDAATLEALDV